MRIAQCCSLFYCCYYCFFVLESIVYRINSISPCTLSESFVAQHAPQTSSVDRMYPRRHRRQSIVVDSSSRLRSRRSRMRTGAAASARWRLAQPGLAASVTVSVASTSAGRHAVASGTRRTAEHLPRKAHQALEQPTWVDHGLLSTRL